MTGPAGERWEVYTVLADSDTFGTSPQQPGADGESVCCGDAEADDSGTKAGAGATCC